MGRAKGGERGEDDEGGEGRVRRRRARVPHHFIIRNLALPVIYRFTFAFRLRARAHTRTNSYTNAYTHTHLFLFISAHTIYRR